MPSLTKTRLIWLFRRLSRIYPAEIPYRVVSTTRAALQRLGWFDASSLPDKAPDASFGKTWVRVPQQSGVVDSRAILAEADRILTQGVQVFDVTVPLNDGAPDWNRDPKTGTAIAMDFGLDIDFRHIAGGIDIKYLWELNRHIWWVSLAQAYAVSRDDKYRMALSRLLDNWLTACPYPSGPNWSSPVEHGIRLINWSIVWHLIGEATSPIFDGADGRRLLDRWLASIYQHIRFASDNYSFYSSADNHLIGEAAGVFVGANTWDQWPQARALRQRAKTILEREMLKQFAPDGVNLEQAICYHKFSLEFLLASLLCGTSNADDFSPEYKARMRSAIEFLAAITDCSGRPSAIGDSDDGRVFGFIGDGSNSAHEALLRAGALLFNAPTLNEKLKSLGIANSGDSLWLHVDSSAPTGISGQTSATLPEFFESGGYAVLGKDLHSDFEFRITMDIGPLGYNKIAGHGHADALSITLGYGGQDFLVDPGTYCYNAAPDLRHYFRGTSAHNTVTIDDEDQSVYGGSFLWLRDVATSVHEFSDQGGRVVLQASHDGYLRLQDPVRHFRRLFFDRETLETVVEDRFECARPHDCKLHWHFSPDCEVKKDSDGWIANHEIGKLEIRVESPDLSVSVVSGREQPPMGWYSRRFYDRKPTQVLIAAGEIGPSEIVKTRFAFHPTT